FAAVLVVVARAVASGVVGRAVRRAGPVGAPGGLVLGRYGLLGTAGGHVVHPAGRHVPGALGVLGRHVAGRGTAVGHRLGDVPRTDLLGQLLPGLDQLPDLLAVLVDGRGVGLGRRVGAVALQPVVLFLGHAQVLAGQLVQVGPHRLRR